MTLSDLPIEHQRAALESLINWCRGQAIHAPTTKAHRDYNNGVDACVRIMEDALPPADAIELGPILIPEGVCARCERFMPLYGAGRDRYRCAACAIAERERVLACNPKRGG